MKKLPVLFFAALSVCACNTNGMDPFGPFGSGGDQPMPPGTEGSTYEFSTIEYDGLLLQFSRPSIYIEGSLEKISDLTSTPSINLSHQTLH